MRLQQIKSNMIDYIVTIDSPIKGIIRVRVKQRDADTIDFTLSDGISAGYGFGMKLHGAEISSISREDIYNAAKDFIEQLGTSGYLDDEP